MVISVSEDIERRRRLNGGRCLKLGGLRKIREERCVCLLEGCFDFLGFGKQLLHTEGDHSSLISKENVKFYPVRDGTIRFLRPEANHVMSRHL